MDVSVEGRRGRQKKTWLNVIVCDTRTGGVCVYDVRTKGWPITGKIMARTKTIVV